MNIWTKIVLIIVGAFVVVGALGYFMLKMPVSPGFPAFSTPTPTPSGTQGSPSGNNSGSAAQPATGAYTRLLGESDFDNSIFNAEVLDVNLLTAETMEFNSVGNSYTETVLPGATDFCTKLPDLADAVIAKIESRGSIVSSRVSQLTVQVSNGRKARDDQKNSVRLQNSSARDRFVERLAASSSSNAVHKSAVEKFVASITDAINNRRMAINSAQQSFRQEMDEARIARGGLITTSITNFKNSVSTAFTKAKADCSAGVAPATVRTNFQTSFTAAHDKFVSDRSAAEKLATNLQSVVTARKSAVAKALSDFKLAMESARKTFKAAFPQGE